MDFALMFCPYCGGDIETGDGSRYLCKECGKSIYTDRESIRQFIRPGELEDTFREALDALEDDNPKKALALADDILKASEETDFDAFFLRGAIYAYEGEDGKAFNDWKRGLELLSVYTNIDAYVCLMTRCVSEMIFKKEEEFVEFHPVKYLDKLCDEIYANTNESCKAFMYYSVYMEYRKILGRNEASGNEGFNEIVPELFRRVVEYGHNFWSLPHVINEYLAAIGYDPETYEDDDQEDAHVYDLIAQRMRFYTEGMDPADVRRANAHWNDEMLRENEYLLEAMLPRIEGMFGKLLSRKTDEAPVDIDIAVDSYVRRCLLLDPEEAEASEEPQVLE